MRQFFVSALIACMAMTGSGPAFAQQTSTYIYDAQGRLVSNATAVTSGTSTLSNYTYDNADNRTQNWAFPITRSNASQMQPGENLIPGQAVVSPDGQSRLELRSNGALVITCNGADQLVLYAPNGAAMQLNMQGDGNLVLYNYLLASLWASSTSGYPGAFLQVQDDGNVVIYQGATPIWSSSTFC